MDSKTQLHDRFGYRISVLSRRWRAIVDAELEGFGLSQATWRPLFHLASFAAPPRQCELAEALALGGPAVVRLVDQLEEMGLAERFVDEDRRANKIRLTRAGKRLAARVHDITLAVERNLLQDVSADELGRVFRALEAIEARVDDRIENAQSASPR